MVLNFCDLCHHPPLWYCCYHNTSMFSCFDCTLVNLWATSGHYLLHLFLHSLSYMINQAWAPWIQFQSLCQKLSSWSHAFFRLKNDAAQGGGCQQIASAQAFHEKSHTSPWLEGMLLILINFPGTCDEGWTVIFEQEMKGVSQYLLACGRGVLMKVVKTEWHWWWTQLIKSTSPPLCWSPHSRRKFSH